MGTTAEGSPTAVFDWFFEAARPSSLQEDPLILRQFPPDFRDQEAMQMVPKFCFPFDVEREPPSPAVQHFTFALTDLVGNRRFGFCRLRAGARSCLCILSHLPWFEVFYKVLNTVGDLLAQDQVSEAEETLLNLLQQDPPGPQATPRLELGSGAAISSGQGAPPVPGKSRLLPCFVVPDSGCLPSIPENRNLTELVVAVTDENLVGLFAALLAERRVLLTASKLSTLTSCVHASCALLYPMRWEHVLIPTLPPHLLDYCCAPMPYLIGVHASLAEKVRDKALEDVVVLNVDSNTLETPFEDVRALPPDVVSLLRLRLRKAALTPGEGVSRLFLKAQALLFGGYRDALVYSPGLPATFSEESFLAQKPGAPLQAFHQRAVHLQLFKQFIEARLEKLNSGEGFSDEFEQEITRCGASSGTLRSYQLWADNLKKGGGALLHSVKAKTQPAVKNIYRSARSGWKGMQSLLVYKDGDSGLHRGGSLRAPALTSRSERLQQRLPITRHFGQNRPLRPSKRLRLEEITYKPPGERSPSLSPEDTPGLWPEEALDSSFLGSGEELDLLSEILDSLSIETKSTSSLRPSQSLDCCHQGDPGTCFSLFVFPSTQPHRPGRTSWQPEDQTELEPQPRSLPGDLSTLHNCQSLDATSYPQNPTAQTRPKANQVPSQFSATAADLSTEGNPEASPAIPPGIQHHPGSGLSAEPTQPSPPDSPQLLLVPPESTSDTTWTSPSLESSLDPSSPEDPGAQLPELLLPHAEEQGIPDTSVSHTRGGPEPQAARRPRVADLKKCFES
ncbi:DENN domain-containing protein 1C isoform X3 [Cavia porcellus]|uniref:DENN domain-containing protein 1C isoform X3 n=1 Tax=Cavia porcellus TaxID=10141 RepID=UPI002FE12B93